MNLELAQAFVVRDLMSPEPLTLHPDDAVASLRETFAQRSIRHMPVVDDAGKVCGVISQRDLAELTEDAAVDTARTVADCMHRDVELIDAGCPVPDAAVVIYASKRGCLPVIESGRLVGILTESDFVRWWMRESRPSPDALARADALRPHGHVVQG